MPSFANKFDTSEGMYAFIFHIEECQKLAEDIGKGWSDVQLVRSGQTTMGRSGLYADAYMIRQRRASAQKTWIKFKTYWTNTFQEHEDVNKLMAENSGFGACLEVTAETNNKELEAAMKTVFTIMSTDK